MIRYEFMENHTLKHIGKCRVYSRRKKGKPDIKVNWIMARLTFNRYLCNL